MRWIQVKRGHASARKLERIPADAEGANDRAAAFAEEVVGDCEASQASAAPLFREKVHVDPLSPGDASTLHAADIYPDYSLLSRGLFGGPFGSPRSPCGILDFGVSQIPNDSNGRGRGVGTWNLGVIFFGTRQTSRVPEEGFPPVVIGTPERTGARHLRSVGG